MAFQRSPLCDSNRYQAHQDFVTPLKVFFLKACQKKF